VKLNATGIRVTYIGQAEVILCRNGTLKKIGEVQTGD
jgi:hypothetical protein